MEGKLIRCENCRKEFEPKNYWQKYCSKTCKMIDWYSKKKQKEEKESK